jgi:CheY-like chemotaxis protein
VDDSILNISSSEAPTCGSDCLPFEPLKMYSALWGGIFTQMILLKVAVRRKSHIPCGADIIGDINPFIGGEAMSDVCILLGHDSPQTTSQLVQWLTDAGHVVKCCTTFSTASQLCDAFHFDLLILQTRLSDGSAVDFLQTRKLRDPNVRAIALRSTSMLDECKSLLGQGFIAAIPEPLDGAELNRHVAAALAG